ncbi:MAG: hypothetical protein ABW063_10870 [Caulobacter sp.]
MRRAAAGLNPVQWLVVPMLICIAAAILFAMPARAFGFQMPEPMWALVPAFAWGVIRPSVLAPFALLVLGLFFDGFWGGPIGLWALALLIVYAVVIGLRNILSGQSGLMMFLWYAGCIALAMAVGYAFMIFGELGRPGPVPVFWQFLVTVALYPAAAWLIERFEDQDVRFR